MGEIPLNHIYVPETFTLYLKYLGFISLSFHTTAKAFPLNMSLQVGVPGRLRCPNRTWPRVSSGFGFRFSAGLGSGTPVKPSEAVLLRRLSVRPSVWFVSSRRSPRLCWDFPALSAWFPQHVSLVVLGGGPGCWGPSRSLRRPASHTCAPGRTHTPFPRSFPHAGARDGCGRSRATPGAHGTHARACVCCTVSHLESQAQ